jgi:adenine-specific DNA-methyltransferase
MEKAPGLCEVWPIWDDGFEGCWTWGKELAEQERQLLTCHDVKGRPKIFRKSYAQRDGENVGRKPKTIWIEKEFQTEKGQSALDDCFGKQLFRSPKATALVAQCILLAPSRKSNVLDFFSGSGTTGHAVINLNREDGGKRKYILVEMGDHLDTVLKPRLQKVVYSKDWKDGKPVSREGSSHLFKYIRLESYEDALNNLELKRTGDQDDLLRQHAPLREDYLLRYQLDVESAGSASLLNIAAFANPFAYQLKIATGSVGESRAVNVDLVETFNYLLGLRVSHTDTIRGFKVVTGLNPAGEKTLVIWRNVAEKSNADLDAFFQKQGYNTKDMEFAVIYVNGDNNLENLKRADETWKVRRTEDEFKRLMFDVQDV